MDPDATQPHVTSLGDLPTVGYEAGEPHRALSATNGSADDDVCPEVPGFDVQKELGRGGMGVVYLARQINLNRSVALKLLPADKQLGTVARQRFQAEAESAAKVAHPGIVAVYEIGSHAGRPYFALEFCPGGSLADKLAGTPLPLRIAAELMETVARAVQAAHAAGVVHRDLKPHNVLFAVNGSPKVTDFGLAKPVESNSHLTTDGAILGTPSYMAPEQARGDSKLVGPAADIYALGAVLYECLTGRPPFRSATLMETLAQVISADPVAPRRLVPGLPKDLETICLKNLAKEPGKRYPTAAAMADDLRRYLDDRPIQAHPVSLSERAWKTLRRRPEIGVITGVVLGCLGVVFGVLASSNARLTQERNAAVTARTDAETAKEQADTARGQSDQQRRKADARLVAAVDAIEQMIGHTTSDAWTAHPGLQDERRKLLEEAVRFYEGLARAGDDDPVVRREQARAYLRAGRAWLGLGDNSKAVEACRSAAGLADQLVAEQPSDPERLKASAEAHASLGHALAVDAQYDGSLNEYRRSLELAERAMAVAPSDTDAALAVVRSRCSLANFHRVGDPTRALTEATSAIELARRLAAPADAPAANRLALAASLTLLTTLHAAAGRPVSQESFAEARAALAAVGPVPPGELSETKLRVQATLDLNQSTTRLATARGPDDFRSVVAFSRAALKSLDALGRIQPKAFPYRVHRYQALTTLGTAADRLGDTSGQNAALVAADALGEEIMRDSPSGVWVLTAGLIRRSMRLVQQVQAGRLDGFAAESAVVQTLADKCPPAVAGVMRYNLACGYSLMAKRGPEADRELYATKAVGLLDRLAVTGYFKNPVYARTLTTDPDLNPLRDRPDFKTVLAKVIPKPAAPSAAKIGSSAEAR